MVMELCTIERIAGHRICFVSTRIKLRTNGHQHVFCPHLPTISTHRKSHLYQVSTLVDFF